jgi:O-antigen/teichoic acid export membrane protein
VNIKEKMLSVANKWFPEKGFAKNVATLMSGTIFAQFISIAISPILTRLYSPEYFGNYSYFNSIVGIFAVIVCWRYELAIVIPSDDSDSANILFIAIFIYIVMSICILLFVLFFALK